MISRNRLFERQSPTRLAKSIYIFCEGVKREYQYFRFFREMDSRLNIEVYELSSTENNSPRGLMQIAEDCILKSDENPNPKYDFKAGDEVWIVMDVDKDATNSRVPQVDEILSKIDTRVGWDFVQSNPCFEVWLMCHFRADMPDLENPDQCKSWKQILPGGFNSKKHPIHIGRAVGNAKVNFVTLSGLESVGTTDVFRLGEEILALTGEKIRRMLALIES